MIFISNEYEEVDNLKVSSTLMKHMGQYFYGDAITAPDEPNPSELFGGRLSEARAMLHGFQYENMVRYNEFHTIQNLVNACCQTKKFDKESSSAKVLFHQLNIAEKRYKEAREKVRLTKEGIKRMLDERDKYFEKRAKKDNK